MSQGSGIPSDVFLLAFDSLSEGTRCSLVYVECTESPKTIVLAFVVDISGLSFVFGDTVNRDQNGASVISRSSCSQLWGAVLFVNCLRMPCRH